MEIPRFSAVIISILISLLLSSRFVRAIPTETFNTHLIHFHEFNQDLSVIMFLGIIFRDFFSFFAKETRVRQRCDIAMDHFRSFPGFQNVGAVHSGRKISWWCCGAMEGGARDLSIFFSLPLLSYRNAAASFPFYCQSLNIGSISSQLSTSQLVTQSNALIGAKRFQMKGKRKSRTALSFLVSKLSPLISRLSTIAQFAYYVRYWLYVAPSL